MAKAKTKKISITAMDKVVKDTYTPSSSIQWNGLDVQIKRSLTFLEMMELVDSVVKTCFTAETGMYIPEAKDFAIKSNIVERPTLTSSESLVLRSMMRLQTTLLTKLWLCLTRSTWTKSTTNWSGMRPRMPKSLRLRYDNK